MIDMDVTPVTQPRYELRCDTEEVRVLRNGLRDRSTNLTLSNKEKRILNDVLQILESLQAGEFL